MFRTMIFKRVPEDSITIDGVSYEVTNSANTDHVNCKDSFLELTRHLEQYYDDGGLEPDNLASFKKDMTNKLKDFERKYQKHSKGTNPLLADIHKKAMQPTVDLCEASFNLQNFRILNEKRPFPEFRKKALTEKFIEYLTAVCKILNAFPYAEGKTLDEEYDIRHIIEILFEVEGWQDCPPLAFYFSPFKKTYDELVDELRRMHNLGPLRMSFYIERNLGMVTRIIDLVHQYNIVKVLAGDDLKRDQFKFIYKVHERIYDCALKDIYLNPKQNQMVIQAVVPEMTVYEAMTLIRKIDD